VAANVESVKTAAEIYAPCGGTVCEVNATLESAPEKVNEAPEGGGWLFKLRDVKASDLDSLMSAAEYDEFLNA
jgi:glycine cleavage system H protein